MVVKCCVNVGMLAYLGTMKWDKYKETITLIKENIYR